MEVEDAFEKWLSDWVSRNPGGELSPKTVWFVASRWGYGQNADKIAAIEAERDALRKDAERYRWLRDQWGYLCVGEGVIELEGKFNPMDGFLDEAIAAAIAAKEPK